MTEPTDKKFDSKAEKIERTGVGTFNVTHDDGSIFECAGDPNVISKLVKANHPKEKNSHAMGVSFDEAGRLVRSK